MRDGTAIIGDVSGNTEIAVGQSSVRDSHISFKEPKAKATKMSKSMKFAISAIGLIASLIAIYEFFIKPYLSK